METYFKLKLSKHSVASKQSTEMAKPVSLWNLIRVDIGVAVSMTTMNIAHITHE